MLVSRIRSIVISMSVCEQTALHTWDETLVSKCMWCIAGAKKYTSNIHVGSTHLLTVNSCLQRARHKRRVTIHSMARRTG